MAFILSDSTFVGGVSKKRTDIKCPPYLRRLFGFIRRVCFQSRNCILAKKLYNFGDVPYRATINSISGLYVVQFNTNVAFAIKGTHPMLFG